MFCLDTMKAYKGNGGIAKSFLNLTLCGVLVISITYPPRLSETLRQKRDMLITVLCGHRDMLITVLCGQRDMLITVLCGRGAC